MTAQGNLHHGSEPAQLKTVLDLQEKGSFREIHLHGEILHPAGVCFLGEEAHPSRVAGKGLGGKGVNLSDKSWHPLSPFGVFNL
jgi:hypothetical protein